MDKETKVTNTLLNEREIARRKHIKELKKKRLEAICMLLLLFLTFYVVLSLCVGIYYKIKFDSAEKAVMFYDVQTVTGEGKRRKAVTFTDREDANNYYGLYIAFDDLNKLCKLSSAGDSKKLTVIFRDTNEYLECCADSSLIYINTIPTRLSVPILYDNGYYFPIELISDYFLGVNVVFEDEKEVCTITLTGKPLELKLKKQTSPERIKEPSLSEPASDTLD